MRPACTLERPEALRPPGVAMRLARLGSHFATRLSFARVLVRDLIALGAVIDRPVHGLDADGFGTVVYRVRAAGECYSLCCFSTPLAADQRTDRVIAQAWDASFVLYDGEPGEAELARLRANAPLQEAGRYRATDLVLSRANRSVRLFEHVVQSLTRGRQPDAAFVREVGYLMRTTAVYGNGKFGLADRALIAGRRLLRGPFRPEMLAVYLIRLFTHELVEHIAAARAPRSAALLSEAARRALGIGNATGLGMAPFIVRHAQLFNNWMLARETALARVLAQPRAHPAARDRFERSLPRVLAHLAQWQTDDPRQREAIAALGREVATLRDRVAACLAGRYPWARVFESAAGDSLQMQEVLVSLLLEPHGALVDGLADCCDADEVVGLDTRADCGSLLSDVRARAGWALDIDMGAPGAQALFWYVSEEKLEPRLGLRAEEPGAEREMPLAVARDYQALEAALSRAGPAVPLADWLADHPSLRHVVMRLQSLAAYPFADIRDNLVDGGCVPVDLLRCKLAMFGASRFDPKSDRWTRITLFHGAPPPDALGRADAEDWSFAVVPDDLDDATGARGRDGEARCRMASPATPGSDAAMRTDEPDGLDLSCGEFEQLVVKAALGADLEHGLAAEFASAATALAVAQGGLAADAVLAALSEARSPGPCATDVVAADVAPSIRRFTAGPLVRLIPAALDLVCGAGGARVELPAGLSVAWLAAYAGTRSRPGETVIVASLAESPGTSESPGLPVALDRALSGGCVAPDGVLVLTSAPGQAWRASLQGRVPIRRSSWDALQRLAMRTTVPSSVRSRARGAGAEIDDSV